MIEDAQGNLLEADVDALVNTVNTVGYMGKGIATADDAVEAVHGWNDRKRRMFSPAHIRVAWSQLTTEGWIADSGS